MACSLSFLVMDFQSMVADPIEAGILPYLQKEGVMLMLTFIWLWKRQEDCILSKKYILVSYPHPSRVHFYFWVLVKILL